MPDRNPDNPLLSGRECARYDEIEAKHVIPGIRTLLSELDERFSKLETEAQATWESLAEPLERIVDEFICAWGTVNHLLNVKNSAALRAAHQEVQGEVVSFGTRLGQSPAIYRKLTELTQSPAYAGFSTSQQRAIESLIKDARHSGVGLAEPERSRFNEIENRLAQLKTQFQNNVLDSTKAYSLQLTDPKQVEGLPTSLLELAAQSARSAGEQAATAEDGPWRITLDMPSYGPFLEYCRERSLREEVYRAYTSRASSGDFDNRPLIVEILRLRREKAGLLGFESYADESLDRKMAPDVEAVETLIEELREACAAPIVEELHALEECARRHEAPESGDIKQWDIAFWANRLRKEQFGYEDEELRPYFPLEHVLSGVFEIAHRLFGVRIEPSREPLPTWQEHVRQYDVFAPTGEKLALFFLDPYSRPEEKRSGAWMDPHRDRTTIYSGEGLPVRLPVCNLICNQSPPTGEKPSLLTFGQVQTIFHEFGHGLQHMLTTGEYSWVSGIRGVEWDAVELPSQFMENWCYQPEMLRSLSRHHETGKPLPDELVEKLIGSRNFRTGSKTMRQLCFAALDLKLHHSFDPDGPESPFKIQREFYNRYSALPPLPEDHFLCTFSHVFAGSYAAGYYSYKWAEVLSADAFGAFEEAGLDTEATLRTTGHRFRDTILALGGSQHPLEIYRAFRGRDATSDSLLRQLGLKAS